MKNTKALKKDLNNVTSLRDLVSSLEELSAMRYRKTKKNVLDTRGFLDEISVLYKQVKNNYISLKTSSGEKPEIKYRKPTKKVCYIFLSANGGLFGDVINRNFSNLKSYLKRLPPDELIVVGSVGARLFEFSEVKNLVPNTYFPLSDSSGDKENLDTILKYALDFEKIVIFYTKYVEILNQSPTADSVTGDIIFEESVLESSGKVGQLEEDFLYEPGIEKILAIFENQMISSLFEQKVLESGLSKFTSRMVSLDSASEKIKQNMVKIRMEYQKMKHSEASKKSVVQIAGFISQL
ncbi:MAG: hypothetical protein EBV07_00360 [Proteobacteria bacterium]|nr:hypothetical protein [Pseudomonadota bacterium]